MTMSDQSSRLIKSPTDEVTLFNIGSVCLSLRFCKHLRSWLWDESLRCIVTISDPFETVLSIIIIISKRKEFLQGHKPLTDIQQFNHSLAMGDMRIRKQPELNLGRIKTFKHLT